MLRWCSVQYFVEIHELQTELGVFVAGERRGANFETQCRISSHNRSRVRSYLSTDSIPVIVQRHHLLAHVCVYPRLSVLSVSQESDETFTNLTLPRIACNDPLQRAVHARHSFKYRRRGWYGWEGRSRCVSRHGFWLQTSRLPTGLCRSVTHNVRYCNNM